MNTNISEKLKQARSAAKLSQETVAEKVGVSRQTISNWETGKSYPDIASIVILGDVYEMTLDSLLKDDKALIKHYKDSTDVAKSNRQMIFSLILIMAIGVAGLILRAFIADEFVLNLIVVAAITAVVVVHCIAEGGINMFFLGLGIFLIFNALTIVALGGVLLDFISIPSIMIVIIPLLAVLTITRSYRVFFAGLRVAVSPNHAIADQLRQQAISLFRLLSKTAVLAAIISLVISMTNMVLGVDWEMLVSDMELFARVLALNTSAAFNPLYSALILVVIVFEPVVYILTKRNAQ
ncbi:MAG: helix-turn-helix domain-containing protein [Oscillospiraceae bacterium]|nr:helix-turn-helix domain-containing protein [Oscillospiraceae bacterium]